MDKKRFVHALMAVMACMCLMASSGNTAERFPLQLPSAKIQLKRCSQAELKAFHLIHVGNVALYLEECNQAASIFSNAAKHLRFSYDKAIPANAFQDASVKYLEINLGEKFSQWKSQFEQFNSHYLPVKAGDYYDLIYHPQTGLLMQLNGKDLAMLKDQDMALAYLNVWFGNEPFSEDLKNQLLHTDN